MVNGGRLPEGEPTIITIGPGAPGERSTRERLQRKLDQKGRERESYMDRADRAAAAAGAAAGVTPGMKEKEKKKKKSGGGGGGGDGSGGGGGASSSMTAQEEARLGGFPVAPVVQLRHVTQGVGLADLVRDKDPALAGRLPPPGTPLEELTEDQKAAAAEIVQNADLMALVQGRIREQTKREQASSTGRNRAQTARVRALTTHTNSLSVSLSHTHTRSHAHTYHIRSTPSRTHLTLPRAALHVCAFRRSRSSQRSTRSSFGRRRRRCRTSRLASGRARARWRRGARPSRRTSARRRRRARRRPT